jgi:hypothetical protein
MAANSDSTPTYTQFVHIIPSGITPILIVGNQDGKVCLSLLGTWSGPGWVAGRSTLLQVCLIKDASDMV